MRSALALMRASLLAAASYRLAMVLSVVGLLATLVPLYFVSGALQPIVAESIATEGGRYFGFVLVGIGTLYVVAAALQAVPAAIGANIGNGTLEALLVTRTPVPYLLLGLAGYPLAFSVLRALLLLAGATAAGVVVHWGALPAAALVLALLAAAHLGIGLVPAALLLLFRTAGPFTSGVLALSALLGGAYYSTSVIPAFVRPLAAVVPLGYGLRPLRRMLLGGESFGAVAGDVAMLALLAATLLALGALALGAALRHARRAGTLGQY